MLKQYIDEVTLMLRLTRILTTYFCTILALIKVVLNLLTSATNPITLTIFLSHGSIERQLIPLAATIE